MFRSRRHDSPRSFSQRAHCLGLVAGAAILITGATGIAPAGAGSVTIQPTIAAPQGVPAGADVATQVIYIVPVSPPAPGIRRAPVAEPVIYVIEQDESERASVRAVR